MSDFIKNRQMITYANPPEVKTLIQQLAEHEGQSQSAVINQLICEALTARGLLVVKKSTLPKPIEIEPDD